MNEIVKGLNGDALQTAMDFSVDELVGPKGIEKLVDAMRLMVFPSKKSEAKELYRAGQKQNGMLSRQKGESMMAYISRRRRWWKLLKQMDDQVYISDYVLGDLLLDSAGITDDQSSDCDSRRNRFRRSCSSSDETASRRHETRSSCSQESADHAGLAARSWIRTCCGRRLELGSNSRA